jgi:glycosyltransferase involved in cell wall biosynthesis
VGNLPALLRWQWGLLRWLIHHRAWYDVIHACDFDTVLPSLFCKLLWGKRVVYDIFDFYADHLRATPAAIKKLIRWVDLRAIGRADAVILVDDSRREQIAGSTPRRLAVIYNSPEEIILPETAPENSPPAGLRLAYIGLLQVERGLLEILQVLSGHPDWVLDLAGFGGDQERIAAVAEKMPNVRRHGRIPYEQALALSMQADVLFATYDPTIPNHRFSSPNKVFEAMLLGKPIVVARNTNMDRIIERAACGLMLDYGDTGQLEAVLLALSRDPDLRKRLGENGRKAYLEEYSWAIMQARLGQLYAEVAGPPAP